MASNSVLNNNSENYLVPKKTPFNDDYKETNKKLGKGVNGEVVICINKKTNVEYALKVTKLIF